MLLKDLIALFEHIAPIGLAEEWDNPGLLIEPETEEITRILFALDCTPAVAEEAAARGAQLVFTHHPLFFKPVQRIHHSAPDTAAAYRLIRHGIGLYAAHTNLDCAMGGVNDALAAAISLMSVRPLATGAFGEPGIGRVGELPAPLPLSEFAAFVRDKLSAAVRYGGGATRYVSTVAVVGGSGGDFIHKAKAAGADVLLTGEIKHSQALEAQIYGISVVEAGHYETERVVLPYLLEGLQSALDAIQYKVDLLMADTEHAPLMAP
ncbi:MAG: Nif3-like dinuclear metal center hexameric protein [Bacillota bacterium]